MLLVGLLPAARAKVRALWFANTSTSPCSSRSPKTTPPGISEGTRRVGGSTLKALYDVLMLDQSPVQGLLRQQLDARLRTGARRTKPELAMVGGGAGDSWRADGAGVVCGCFAVEPAVKPSQWRPPKSVCPGSLTNQTESIERQRERQRFLRFRSLRPPDLDAYLG